MQEKINFENKVVAFIDILGFKSIVNDASVNSDKLETLKKLINLLNKAVPLLDQRVSVNVPKELIPKHIYISDSIILSAPVSSVKMVDYCGLSVLVMRVIQLTQLLLSKGYLIRGGISTGAVWHGDSNIVGPAYQEAYEIEAETSAPRVELSESAKKLWEHQTEKMFSDMCLNYRDCLMVNGLNSCYILHNSDTDGVVEKTFKTYIDTINSNINNIHNESARYKWWWFKEFFESEIRRKSMSTL
jgi:hypothetical protein